METMQVGDAAFLEPPCLPVSNKREAMLEETLTFLTTLPFELVKMAMEVIWTWWEMRAWRARGRS